MKNLFLFILIATFTSCENSTENVVESRKSIAKELKFSEEPTTEGLCKDGYEPVFEYKFVFQAFKKFDNATCKTGLGFCFQIGMKVTFDCKRIQTVDHIESARFDLNTGDGVAAVERNDTDKTITLIFVKSIESFSLAQNYDFNFFSVGPGCFADFGYRLDLLEGNYPKVVDGNYIKYTIPYVE